MEAGWRANANMLAMTLNVSSSDFVNPSVRDLLSTCNTRTTFPILTMGAYIAATASNVLLGILPFARFRIQENALRFALVSLANVSL